MHRKLASNYGSPEYLKAIESTTEFGDKDDPRDVDDLLNENIQLKEQMAE